MITAATVVPVVESMLADLAIVRILHTDNGGEFCSALMDNMLARKFPKVTHVTGRPYHPESQGAVEAKNKSVKMKLMALLEDAKFEDWVDCHTVIQGLPVSVSRPHCAVAVAMNTTISEPIKDTPIHAAYGFHPIPDWVPGELPPEGTVRAETKDGMADEAVTDLQAGQRGKLGFKAVLLLSEARAPSMHRIGVTGGRVNCAWRAAMEALNPQVEQASFRALKTQRRGQACQASRERAARELKEGSLPEWQEVKEVQVDLCSGEPLGRQHLPVFSLSYQTNVFLLETTQRPNSEGETAAVAAYCVADFQPKWPSIALHVRCEQQEDKQDEAQDVHWEVLEESDGDRKWDSKSPVVEVRLTSGTQQKNLLWVRRRFAE